MKSMHSQSISRGGKTTMKQKNILETSRLLLREMDEGDLSALKEIVQDAETM